MTGAGYPSQRAATAIAVVLDMVFPRRAPVKAASGILAH